MQPMERRIRLSGPDNCTKILELRTPLRPTQGKGTIIGTLYHQEMLVWNTEPLTYGMYLLLLKSAAQDSQTTLVRGDVSTITEPEQPVLGGV